MMLLLMILSSLCFQSVESLSIRQGPKNDDFPIQRPHDVPSQSNPANPFLSRRSCMTGALGGLLTGVVGTNDDEYRLVAFAADEDVTEAMQYRSSLLELIHQTGKSPLNNESAILSTIDKLVLFDPSRKTAATLDDALDGEWKLLWSAKAEAFSPLLKLPPPFKPDSYQYLGSTAAKEVGVGRVAQGLTGGVLGDSQLWLSSGTKVAPDDQSVLEIFPPFRLELGGRYESGRPKKLLVEAGSDAEFRKLNARTSVAQAAPKNRYQQLYLERQGRGSLRISTITDGDPVIVGAIFVHQKL